MKGLRTCRKQEAYITIEKQTIFTIGHSNLDLEAFLHLLKDNKIDVLVDIRSNPYSRFASQFNKDNLRMAIQTNGMKYLFLGKALGGRPKDRKFYYDSEGHVLYSRIAESPLFAQGIKRLIKGIKKYRTTIMCAEENPVNCHRHFLIGRVLADHGVTILHIRSNGEIQSDID